MKRFLKAMAGVFAVSMVVLLTSCADEIGKELMDYSNNERVEFNETFGDAASKYNESIDKYNAGELTDEEMLAVLAEIIRESEELVEKMKEIELETAEVKELNDIAVKISESRLEAYKMLEEMIESGDFTNVDAYNKKMNETDEYIEDFDKLQEELAEEHGVVLEKE